MHDTGYITTHVVSSKSYKKETIMDELLKQTIMEELLEKIKAVQHNVTYRSFLIAINNQTN